MNAHRLDRPVSSLVMGRLLTLALLLLCGPATGLAQDTRYVTDKLFLGLYPQADASEKAITTLVSGTPLTVLERSKYYTRVRTPEGTEGWVKSAYLVEEQPPRLLLDRLQAERDRLNQELETARGQLRIAQQKLAGSSQRLQQLETGHEQQRSALNQLESANRALRGRLDTESAQVPLSWSLGAAGVCLALGLWGGYAWLDHRIRRRHGGFRIR